MGLTKYRRKRRFDRTPEPKGKATRSRGPLRFVVQKHAASRLHYDFRLESDGVLKSWAVPKGPSLNPADKRLAVQVEDHPLDYGSFEGTIPAGNYGAGSVIVWDRGVYTVPAAAGRPTAEAAVDKGLKAGRLRIDLVGEKLRGGFVLTRMAKGEAKNWLLIKTRDEYASDGDVTVNGQSVVSGRTLDTVGPSNGRVRSDRSNTTDRGKGTSFVRPMLATLVPEPFDRPGWLFELKWDGYRAIAERKNGTVRLTSRTGTDFGPTFRPVVEALRRLRHDAILDGEVVVVDAEGRSRFQLLQTYQKTGKGSLVYYVFDVLELDGRNLRLEPLLGRKKKLAKLVVGLPVVRVSEHVLDKGVDFFRAVEAKSLEGVVAKDGTSPYREGIRSRSWLKIKTHMRQEAVVGGYTDPRGRRMKIGALILGVYEGKKLVYIGHTGGGLSDDQLAQLRDRLQPLERKTSPFRTKPPANAPVHWVKPEIVVDVTFREWTDDGVMRQPIFVGVRDDKPPREVRRERPVEDSKSAPASRSMPTLTHPDKAYWPHEGYTKQDLADFYRAVAPVLIPYLTDRPQSLHRFPDGITGKSFFQKDVSRQPPPP